MTDGSPTPDQFWLLTGEVPAGPFTVPQVHDELAAGRVTWQTPACPVGATTWLPLVQTPGIGPRAGGPAPTAAAGNAAGGSSDPPPGPSSAPLPFTPLPATTPAGNAPTRRVGPAVEIVILVALIGLFGAAVYGLYEWVRPLTPTEVCRRLERAKTAAEAKTYATPRMHPLIDALFADKSAADPNDVFEWTTEIDGQRPGTRLVGFRGTTFLPEAGRRVRVEGHIVTAKADGWKADDFVITGVEGSAMPGPVSLVDEYRRPPGPPAGGFARATPAAEGGSPAGAPRAKNAYLQLFDWAKDTIGWGGIVAVGVAVLVALAARDAARNKPRAY